MAQVHPSVGAATVSASASASASSSHVNVTSTRETFTVWMKSLVMHGNGSTVFDQRGQIVYRIDNYGNRSSSEVYLMDLRGNVVFTILRRLKVFGRWRGYKGDITNTNFLVNKERPSFQVTKKGEITVWSSDHYKHGDVAAEAASSCYKLEASPAAAGGSLAVFKIIDCSRRGGGGQAVIAEATRKQSTSGVLLGDDVFTLVVEPRVDHSLIMALVTVYGLMNHKL